MLAIVDSGLANLASVRHAIDRLGVHAFVTDDPAQIQSADHVILPGVGAAGPAMERLRAKGLDRVIAALTQPVLGICLGMQLMFEASTEGASVENPVRCLGLLSGTVDLLQTQNEVLPHMGWNQLELVKPDHPLLDGMKENDFVYFVHSFAAPVSEITVATTQYGQKFSAIVAAGNRMGCQFHPEKSGENGATILANFLKIKG